jgi:hypothetical protein
MILDLSIDLKTRQMKNNLESVWKSNIIQWFVDTIIHLFSETFLRSLWSRNLSIKIFAISSRSTYVVFIDDFIIFRRDFCKRFLIDLIMK